MDTTKQEIVAIAAKLNDGKEIKIKATITDGAINFRFSDAVTAKKMFWTEKEKNKDTKYFERLCSFTEFHDGKNLNELRDELVIRLKNMGFKDWTTKVAKDVEKRFKGEQWKKK